MYVNNTTFWGIMETYISLVVLIESDDRNHVYTECYLHGHVAVGFPKTKTSAPQNQNSGNNHRKKSLQTL